MLFFLYIDSFIYIDSFYFIATYKLIYKLYYKIYVFAKLAFSSELIREISNCGSIFFLIDSINFSSPPLKRYRPNRGNFCAEISIRARNQVQVHRTIPHRLFRKRFALIIQMSLHAAEIIASYVAPLLSTTSLRDANRQCKRIYLKKSGSSQLMSPILLPHQSTNKLYFNLIF